MAGKDFARAFFSLLTLGLLVALSAAQGSPTVTVQQGILVGTTETFQESQFINVNKTIDVFKGIPFAEPPVGQLRFRPPVAKGPWDGTYDATYFRDACVQDAPGGAAVMVWIHGGGFVRGSAVETAYSGQRLVAVGDVIVVSINYRLNVFGFLTTGDETLPGNLGLLDQVKALEWIQQNIGAFGGDTNRITIFGESAGSFSVNFHILSQRSQGLFHQAIQQGMLQSTFCWTAVVDGTFLVDTPANLYATGRTNHVELLIGTNKDEGTPAIAFSPRFASYATSDVPPTLSAQDFDELVSGELSSFLGGDNEQLQNAIWMQYIDWSKADSADHDYFRSFVEYETDFGMACGTDRVARFHSQGGDSVFLYQMTHVPSVSFFSLLFGASPRWLGSTHAEDLSFVFGLPFAPETEMLYSNFTDDERALSVKFMKFWTTFAKTG
ncbi:acetylcholinesterase-1-like [Acanthaster planci]|uniref:Carboxylic ester hydrolase n=1 Tax=Acanthaster planci TaxID=133434 RepID=A0A8B7ZQ88_ACAPL|nr:acetylcholinesterase-1-like [Acanthaster planci]